MSNGASCSVIHYKPETLRKEPEMIDFSWTQLILLVVVTVYLFGFFREMGRDMYKLTRQNVTGG